MVLAASVFGNGPGQQAEVDTYEGAPLWSQDPKVLWTGAEIAPGCIDIGNTPNYELRPGLILGLQTATGLLSNYVATNTDGTGVAYAVLINAFRMQDIFTGVTTAKFYRVAVGGPLQTAFLLGLDQQAIAQLSTRFTFDTNIPGLRQFPFAQQQTKTANYQITQADNCSQFNNFGATGPVTLTLPPIANGYFFSFSAQAAQNLLVTSTEGGNIIADTLTRSTCAFQTGGQIIGGGFNFYSNPGATKWICEDASAGTQTATFS